jgi:hypothetical protein
MDLLAVGVDTSSIEKRLERARAAQLARAIVADPVIRQVEGTGDGAGPLGLVAGIETDELAFAAGVDGLCFFRDCGANGFGVGDKLGLEVRLVLGCRALLAAARP